MTETPTAVVAKRTLRRNIAELPTVGWFLVIGGFVNQLGSFAAVFLVLFLRRRGFAIAETSFVLGAYGVGELIAGLVGGTLADRVGRRATIVLSMLSSAAVMIGLSQARSYASILALAGAAGVTSEMYRPAAGALLTDVVAAGNRVTAFAVFRFSTNLGFAAGGGLAGFLANHSFSWVFFADAASSIVFALIAVVALRGGEARSAPEESPVREGRGVLRDRGFVLFLVGTLFAGFVYAQSHSGLPLHVQASGLSTTALGLLLSLNGALVVALELPVSAITMRLPTRQTYAVGVVLLGLGFALTSFAHSIAALAVTVVVWTVGETIAAPVGSAYVADVAPESMRGRYQGLFSFSWGVGSVTGPALGIFLFSRSIAGLWMLCGLLGVVGAILILGARRAPAREAAERRADTVERAAASPHWGLGWWTAGIDSRLSALDQRLSALAEEVSRLRVERAPRDRQLDTIESMLAQAPGEGLDARELVH